MLRFETVITTVVMGAWLLVLAVLNGTYLALLLVGLGRARRQSVGATV